MTALTRCTAWCYQYSSPTSSSPSSPSSFSSSPSSYSSILIFPLKIGFKPYNVSDDEETDTMGNNQILQ